MNAATAPTPAHEELGLASAARLTIAGLPRLAAGVGAARLAHVADRLGFVLLLLSVFALVCPPGGMLPALAGAPIYEWLIGACLAVSLPRVLALVSWGSLRE